jgi:plasmid maintenance system antidote protein VapI
MAIFSLRSSPELALRLSKLFRNSPEFWLTAQRAVDL